MVTFKKFKYIIFSLLAIAVIASATAFSVSYAKWVSPANDSLGANLSTGNWDNKPTSVSDGIMVGDKPYYSFDYKEGNETFDKCVIKVKKGESFQIFSNGTICSYSGFIININNNLPFENADTFTYTGNDEYAFIEVTVAEHIISNMSIRSYSFELSRADYVVGLLKSSTDESLERGILTAKDKVIPFDGTTVSVDEGEKFYLIYNNSLINPIGMGSVVDEDDWTINFDKTTFTVREVSNTVQICTMKGKGTISANIVDGQPNIVISLDDSSISPTTITKDSYGDYIVYYGD